MNKLDDYEFINEKEFNKLIPGGYIKYVNRNNILNSGCILVKAKYPVLVLKSFRTKKIWRINILETKIYYKKNAAPGYNKLFSHLLNGLENNTIKIQ